MANEKNELSGVPRRKSELYVKEGETERDPIKLMYFLTGRMEGTS